MIQPAGVAHVDEVFFILQACRYDLEKQHIFQWTAAYPDRDSVAADIAAGHVFCFYTDGRCTGTISLNQHQEKEYAAIPWQFEEGRALVIHRLAIHPDFQGQGQAAALMAFAEDFAKQQRYTSIRFDAYSENTRSLKFYEKRGYINKGQIFFPGRTAHFYCFEKAI